MVNILNKLNNKRKTNYIINKRLINKEEKIKKMEKTQQTRKKLNVKQTENTLF